MEYQTVVDELLCLNRAIEDYNKSVNRVVSTDDVSEVLNNINDSCIISDNIERLDFLFEHISELRIYFDTIKDEYNGRKYN